MGGRREVPQRLLRLEQRLAAWRRARDPGDRIPKPLWRSAAKLAVEYGLSPTARTLKLDHYSLKQRAESLSLESDSRPVFMELPSASLPHASDHLLMACQNIENLGSLDVGGGTSVAAIRELFGDELPIDIAPLVDDLLSDAADPLLTWADHVLEQNAGGPLTIGYHIDNGYNLDHLWTLQDRAAAWSR